MCHYRYIEYTLMYIGYECIGYKCACYIKYTLMYIGYVEYNEYSFMYFIIYIYINLITNTYLQQ